MRPIGAHCILFSADPEADRAFFRDVLGLGHVDAGGGWLIFSLPPAELAVHPTDAVSRHEVYLQVDDIDAFVRAMGRHALSCGEISEEPWGRLVRLRLPSGTELGVYEPRHARPGPR